MNQSSSKPPLFEKPPTVGHKQNNKESNRSQSKQPNFTFAEDSLASKPSGTSGGDSLIKDSLLKGQSKTQLVGGGKSVTLPPTDKKVYVKKELTHHVIVKNEKLLR